MQAWAGTANKDSQDGKESGRREYRCTQKDSLPEPAEEQHPTNPQGRYDDRREGIIETTENVNPGICQ